MISYIDMGTTAGSSTADITFIINNSSTATNFITWDPNATVVTLPSDNVGDPGRRLPPPLEFNKFINASDLLEEFITFLGEEGVRQGEVFQISLEHFIKWLVLKACEVDGEEPGVVMPALPAPKKQPRCLGCGQFMPNITPLPIHDERCGHFHFARVKARE